MKIHVFWVLGIVVLSVICVSFAYSLGKQNQPYRFEEATTIESLEISAKYERLLDSTTTYIYKKYGEFLPDTYWENDVYTDLYDDLDCWDRNYLKK